MQLRKRLSGGTHHVKLPLVVGRCAEPLLTIAARQNPLDRETALPSSEAPWKEPTAALVHLSLRLERDVTRLGHDDHRPRSEESQKRLGHARLDHDLIARARTNHQARVAIDHPDNLE